MISIQVGIKLYIVPLTSTFYNNVSNLIVFKLPCIKERYIYVSSRIYV